VVIAARALGASPSPGTIVALGVVAAVTEALAPRASDNLLVPAAVWAAAEVLV